MTQVLICVKGELCLFPSSTGPDMGFNSEKDGFSYSLNCGSTKVYSYNCITVFGVELYQIMLIWNLKSPESFQ